MARTYCIKCAQVGNFFDNRALKHLVVEAGGTANIVQLPIMGYTWLITGITRDTAECLNLIVFT